jgi:hypothetical protein
MSFFINSGFPVTLLKKAGLKIEEKFVVIKKNNNRQLFSFRRG